MLYSRLLFALFIAMPVCLSAQTDKSNYSLLWEITGNDLPAPSYLFGTMHVKDKRAFEFPDSLLLKLDECEAFAMEVHPDTMTNYYFDLYFNNDTANVLKETLSEKAYARLNKMVIEKTGQPIDSLDSKDPKYIEMMLRNGSIINYHS